MVDLGFIQNKGYHKRFAPLKRLHSLLARSKISTAYCCSVDHALAAIWAGKNVFLELGDLHQLGRLGWMYRELDAYLLPKISGLILTSEFFETDYYRLIRNYDSDKFLIVENRLPAAAHSLVKSYRRDLRPRLRSKKMLGIIGSIRFPRILQLINEIVARRAADIELHLFGDGYHSIFSSTQNCRYHGEFRNPEDLPSIYEKIDVNLICYDLSDPNCRLAMPNKLYESVAFMTPIVCMKNCRLGDTVTKYGLGCATDLDQLERAIDETFDHYNEHLRSIESLDESFYMDDDSKLLEFINTRGSF